MAKAPQTLNDLIRMVQETAESFGYKDTINGRFRNCITDSNSGEIRSPKEKEANFWFGYIREDQPDKSVYEGLSYVIFPEYKNTRCLVALGIGSSSIGKDGDLASSPGFRRSFLRLTKSNDSGAKFFFKLRFDEMDTSTPGLQEELFSETSNYEEVIVETTTKYNADSAKESPGLLPAAFIVDYTNKTGWNLVKGWLAQYAKWRNWDKYQKGTEKIKKTQAIQDAISICRNDAKCPDPDEVYSILNKHRFVVLQGAPGCGKTWTANKVSEKYKHVVFTQFHAETTYSDFVYGIRPTLDGNQVAYTGEKGTLLQAIDLANSVKEAREKVLLIIDEINRANLSNVLGPVFYLFEQDSVRKHKLSIGSIYNTETQKTGDIAISELPSNLDVLATMNTADKSLAVVDFALRRRFAWVTLRPHKIDSKQFDNQFFDKVDELFATYATDEELNLQPGQSYFMDERKRADTIKYGLMPLFKEYFAEGFLLPAKEEFAQLFSQFLSEAKEPHVFLYE